MRRWLSTENTGDATHLMPTRDRFLCKVHKPHGSILQRVCTNTLPCPTAQLNKILLLDQRGLSHRRKQRFLIRGRNQPPISPSFNKLQRRSHTISSDNRQPRGKPLRHH